MTNLLTTGIGIAAGQKAPPIPTEVNWGMVIVVVLVLVVGGFVLLVVRVVQKSPPPKPETAPEFCGVCHGLIKRTSYFVTIDGVNFRLCPDCNEQFERRRSSRAMKQFLGD